MTAKVKKTVQGIRKTLRHLSSRAYTIAGALAFAAIGTVLLVSSHAATPTANYETEAGTIAGNASLVSDGGASGGAGAKFSSTATPQTCDLNATTANFAAQVSAAATGQTICLATGNYGAWAGTNKSITIRPQAGATPVMSLVLRSGDGNFTIDGGRQSFDATSGLIIDGDGGPSIASGVSNVTVKNVKFTAGFRIDGPTNANILLDHNLHSDLTTSQAAAAIHLSYGASQPSGVTVQNSLFRDMSADGIQTGIGVNILNNEFARVEPDNPEQHTDAIQSVGGGDIVIRGNYIHEGEQAIGMFDGTGGNTIEYNVIKNFTAHWITLGGDRPGSVVQYNTIVGTGSRVIDCGSKAGYQSSLTFVRNNVAGSLSTSGSVNCTPSQNTNNLFSSGGTGSNFSGTPIFAGGSNPTTYLGYLLAPNSPGFVGATDGGPVGIRQQ